MKHPGNRHLAHAQRYLARAGYATGGALMNSISRSVEDRQDNNPELGYRRSEGDRLALQPSYTADENERTERHLPPDLKQRGQLAESPVGMRAGGSARRKRK